MSKPKPTSVPASASPSTSATSARAEAAPTPTPAVAPVPAPENRMNPAVWVRAMGKMGFKRIDLPGNKGRATLSSAGGAASAELLVRGDGVIAWISKQVVEEGKPPVMAIQLQAFYNAPDGKVDAILTTAVYQPPGGFFARIIMWIVRKLGGVVDKDGHRTVLLGSPEEIERGPRALAQLIAKKHVDTLKPDPKKLLETVQKWNLQLLARSKA